MSELTTTEVQQELKNLRREAKKLTAEQDDGKSTEVPVEKPEPPEGVEVKRSYTEDVKDDTLEEARDAGTLRRDGTRLNMLSRLSPGEDVDHFKFDTSQPGEAKLGLLGNTDDVNVQVLDKFGNVFADSGADKDSEKYSTYTRMLAGEVNLTPGNYAIRAERADNVDSDKTVNYGVQLNQGSFDTDLDTVESNNPNDDGIEEGPRAQGSGTVEQLTKETTDVKGESLDNARDIGRLVQNRSRLNVITTLRNGEEADHYKFDVHREGKGRLSVLNQKDARVELLNAEGETIADSEAESGSEAATNYEKLTKGQFEFQKGEYNIRVAPKEDSDIAKGEAEGGGRTFGLQLSQGDKYVNDYNVIEQGTKEGAKDASNKYENLARQAKLRAGQNTAFLLNSAQGALPNNGVTDVLGGGGPSGILGAINSANQSQIQQVQSQSGGGSSGGGAASSILGGGGGVNQLL